jgi:hypothetical protein
MKNKKIKIIFLIFLIMSFILSGCSGGDKSPNNSEIVKVSGEIQVPTAEDIDSLNNESEFVGIVKDFDTGRVIIDSVEVEDSKYSIQVEASKNIIISFSRSSDNLYLATYIPEIDKELKNEISNVNAESTIVSLILKDNKTNKNKKLNQDDILSLRGKAKEIIKGKNSEEFNNMINNQNLEAEGESSFTKEAQKELAELKKDYIEKLGQHLISGFVYDKNGNPIEKIEIVNSDNKLLATSDDQGEWQFRIDTDIKKQLIIYPVNKEIDFYFEPTDYYKVRYTFKDTEKHEVYPAEITNDDILFYSNELSHKSYNLQDKLRSNVKYEKEISYLYDAVKKPVYWISANQLGEANNTKAELTALQGQPEKLKKEIDNLYEALMYIGTIPDEDLKDNEVTYIDSYPQDDWDWGIDQPTELAIKESKIYGCRPISNVADYLLSDDYEEVGSVFMRNIDGGHSINYIREGDIYYFFYAGNAFHNGSGLAHDTGIVEKDYSHHKYIIKTQYPEQFVKLYANSDQEEDYVFFALYDFNTNPVHLGSKGGSGIFGFPIANDGSNVKVYIDQNNEKEYGFIEAPSNPSTKAPVVEKYSSYDSFSLFFDGNNNVKNEPPEEIVISIDNR